MKKLDLPTIYPITDTAISGLSHLEQAERLASAGATILQVRDKTATPRELFANAVEVAEFLRLSGIRLILNDRVDIALVIGADGVHLGQDDLPVEAARRLLGDRAIIGFSTHSVQQAIEASKLPLDYIAIGPVFSTKTKKDPDPVVGIEGVSAVRDAIGDIPLVAIGGINSVNYRAVLEAGADSVAIISDLLKQPQMIAHSYRSFSAGISNV